MIIIGAAAFEDARLGVDSWLYFGVPLIYYTKQRLLYIRSTGTHVYLINCSIV